MAPNHFAATLLNFLDAEISSFSGSSRQGLGFKKILYLSPPGPHRPMQEWLTR